MGTLLICQVYDLIVSWRAVCIHYCKAAIVDLQVSVLTTL